MLNIQQINRNLLPSISNTTIPFYLCTTSINKHIVKKITLLSILLGGILMMANNLNAQQTIGLFHYSETASEGYTLFAPLPDKNTYLIDNCGNQVHMWSSNRRPGESAYLLENGHLIRAGVAANDLFNAGGKGGIIQEFDWEGNIVWSYTYNNDSVRQHHDFEVLPNGNVLILAWEGFTIAEAEAAGRDPSKINPIGLWGEHLIEVDPTTDEIVWEWHVWDHLIQDFDASKANYGTVEDHPELWDINYISLNVVSADWLHFNSVDYHPALDQIMLSSRALSEIYVIDHSTTTAEAASHTGGNSGRGGDILFRWGNPAAYRAGTEEDQTLFVQHDTHWIPEGLPDAGKVMIFNNGAGRPDGNYSSIDILELPLNTSGTYDLVLGNAYGPSSPFWTYTAPEPTDFFSSKLSGAQQMPNGNTLICEGWGRFSEVTNNGDMVWEYINPVSNLGIMSQGDALSNNGVFRAYRYPLNFAGFQGKDLSPSGPIELNPLPSTCTLNTSEQLVQLKVFLEGPFNLTNGTMDTGLQSGNLIPLTQPYNAVPWNYPGTENVSSINSNVVDWILVEARAANDPNNILETKAALLLADGTVVDADGLNAGVNFNFLTANQDYYFAIKHRNHLAALSATSLIIPNNNPIDFTNPTQVKEGTSQLCTVSATSHALCAGDAVANGVLTYTDFNRYTSGLYNNGYRRADLNLNGFVDEVDFGLYIGNVSKIGIDEIRY